MEYDGARWQTRIVGSVVKQDFGFIIIGQTAAQQRLVLLWGASEFGANIAARAYSDLHRQLSRERYRRVLAGESWLYVAHADVEGYGVRTDDVSNVNIVAAYPGRNG